MKKTFICISNPSTPAHYYSNVLGMMEYFSELYSGKICTLNYYEMRNLGRIPDGSVFNNIEEMTLEDIKSILQRVNPSAIAPYLSQPIEAEGVTQIIYTTPHELTGAMEKMIGLPGVLHVPVFDSKYYSQLKTSVKGSELENRIFYSIYRTVKEFMSLASRTDSVAGFDKSLVEKAANIAAFIRSFGDPEVQINDRPTESGVQCFTISIKPMWAARFQNIHKTKKIGSIVESPIYTFLVPSWGKKCGIGDYHTYQRDEVAAISSDNPIFITHRNIDDLTMITDTVFVHHEYLLYDDPYLSENSSAQLVKMAEDNPRIKFVTFVHTTPAWDTIKNDIRVSYLDKYLGMKNVQAVVFNRTMLERISTYPGVQKSKLKPIVMDLGVYTSVRECKGKAVGGHIAMFGFNNPGKGMPEVVEHIIKNTDHKMLIMGRGSNELAQIEPNRIWAIDDYLPTDEMLKLLDENAAAIVCNRGPHSASSSASYRMALSTGIPVVASNSIAHTSLQDFTGDRDLKYFSSMDEMVQMLNQVSQDDERLRALELSRRLKKDFSIGKVTLELLKRFS